MGPANRANVAMKFFPWQSLKTRVTFFTLAIFLVSIWGLSFYVSRMLHEDMERALGEQQFSTVSFIAAEVNDELKDRMNALELIASGIDAPLLAKPAELHRYLEQRPIFQVLFNVGVFVTGQDGVAVADFPVVAGRVGTNYIDREHVSRVLKEGRSLVGRPIVGRALKGAPSLPISVPIHDKRGKIIGVLVGPNDLSKPNFLDKVTHGRYGSSGGYLIIARQYRLIVTATERRFIMAPLPGVGAIPLIDRFVNGYEGSGVLVNQLGEERLVSTKGIPLASWYVAVSLPTAEAFAPIRAMQQRVLLATIFLTLLAGGLTWWMLRRQLAPMLATVKTLATLSNSDKSPQPLPITRQDEIGVLIGGFNRLLETLGRRDEALKNSQRLLAEAERVGNVGGWEFDINTQTQTWTEEAYNIHEVDLTYEPTVGKGVNFYTPASRPIIARAMQGAIEYGEPFDLELEIITAKGNLRSVNVIGKADRGHHRVYGSFQDITSRKRAEAALREQEEFFRLIAENIDDFIAVLDLDGRRLYNSPSYRRLFGGARDLHSTDSFREIHPEDQQRVKQVFRETVQSGIGHQIEFRFVLEGGDIRHMESRGGVMRDEQGRVTRVLVVSRDITERKQMEDQVRQLAFYDALTKLPNRRLLNERLSQAMAASKRSGRHGALMFLDLDNFKSLNDKHGHKVGDLLLIEAADRLKSCVREMDTVARFGGDEFVVMLSEINEDKAESTAQAGIVAGKIHVALAEPYLLTFKNEGESEMTVEHHCSASIGVVIFSGGNNAKDILDWADISMYQAKDAGRNQIRFYDVKA